MKWSSSQSVVYFVVICIIRVNTCMSLFPSDVAKFSLSMNATMGLRTATFSQGNQVFNGGDRFLLVPDSWKMVLSFCGKQNNQQGQPTIDD